MRRSKIERLGLFISLATAFIFLAGRATRLAAQQEGSNGPSPSRELPVKHDPGTKLTEQQIRGAGVFIQHCALCHLDKTFGAGGSKYCCIRSLGPSLGGLFKNIDADQEKAFREIILNGGPTYMPAFKYGLSSREVDDIVAYLKTLD